MDTSTASEQSKNWQRRRRIILAVLLVGGAAWGTADLLLHDHEVLSRLISIGYAVLLAVALMLWCVYDGRMRGFHVTGMWKWLIVLIAIVGVPFYFWQSRPHRECLRGLFGLFLFAAVAAPYYIVWYSLRYALEKIGYYA